MCLGLEMTLIFMIVGYSLCWKNIFIRHNSRNSKEEEKKKKVILLIKYETAGKIITKFSAPKPKAYPFGSNIAFMKHFDSKEIPNYWKWSTLKKRIPKWPQIPDHLYRILIIDGLDQKKQMIYLV